MKLLDLYPGRVFQCVDHKFVEITRQSDIHIAIEKIKKDEEIDSEVDKQKRIKEAIAENAAEISTQERSEEDKQSHA